MSRKYVAALYVRVKGRPTRTDSIQILHPDNEFHVLRMTLVVPNVP